MKLATLLEFCTHVLTKLCFSKQPNVICNQQRINLQYDHTHNFSQEDLYLILKAYTIHNPHDGYCQAQAPIGAILLMHMPAEQAFWCLVSICEKYLPGYYAPGLVRAASLM